MIYDQHGRSIQGPARQRFQPNVRAIYDSAMPGGPLEKHWTAADWFSPNAGTNPNVRRTLRARCRYEVANGSYAAGIVSTLANYIVGTGPTLRLIPSISSGPRAVKALKDLAQRFNEWAWDIGLQRVLHTMQRSKSADGEGLAMLINRLNARPNQVTLGIRTFESEMLTNPQDYTFFILDKPEGIDVGSDGQPEAYWVLKHHPGGGLFQVYPSDAYRVPAKNVCHWFDELRPGLLRGLPEILPALPMFAMLRRYTSAVVTAAEAAADFAAVMHTDAPPDGGANIAPGTTFEFEKGQIVSLPEGWNMNQLKAEHPGQMHEMFIKTLIREIGRCLDMPYAVAAMDASGHNYSSMRGDWQAFYAAVRCRRRLCEHQVLDKILDAWMQEASLLYSVQIPDDFDFQWDWPSAEPIDATKEAEADIMLLAANLTTYARIYAKRGHDYSEELPQRAREEAMLKELGIGPAQVAPMIPKAGEDGTKKAGEDGGTPAKASAFDEPMRQVRASRRRRAEEGAE